MTAPSMTWKNFICSNCSNSFQKQVYIESTIEISYCGDCWQGMVIVAEMENSDLEISKSFFEKEKKFYEGLNKSTLFERKRLKLLNNEIEERKIKEY